jgi:aspartyl-tRNA(Asn)/glutamyl-tRNA(Gln) amidotransferase subunit C
MIDRAEVLHVARLARLCLDDEEVASMRRDLGSVLGHIEKIGELDLADVSPMAYVARDDVAPAQGLRADEPRPSLPRDVALASAPAVSEDGFLVPSPQA